MPTDEAFTSVLAELSKMSDAWRTHRESINRAVTLLSGDVYKMERRLDEVRRWQWIRLGVELGVLLAIVYYKVI